MWKGQKISVVFSTYREKDSVRKHIDGLFATGVVDEIIAVNNNAEPGTDKEIAKTKARQIFESRQGYGWGYRRALTEAKGDILIMTEPDGTFNPNDVFKLLAYSDDFDVVSGSRTSTELVIEGANMGMFLKYGNWFVAKLMEILFNTNTLTDAGCTMKLLKRKVYERIKSHFTVGGSQFGPELMMLIFLSKAKFIMVPVNYQKRVGKSAVTGSFTKSVVLGIQMIMLIIKYRLLSWFGAIKIRPFRQAQNNN